MNAARDWCYRDLYAFFLALFAVSALPMFVTFRLGGTFWLDVARTKIPCATLFMLHGQWTPTNLVWAAITLLGLASVCLSWACWLGLSSRTLWHFLLACWLASFCFSPWRIGEWLSLEAVKSYFLRNLICSAALTALIRVALSRDHTRSKANNLILIPLFLCVHSLVSLFYVFSATISYYA
jgi:hypothetical protein